MEGKAMKKKIILFLSFLLTAMFLTGCQMSTVITEEEIKEMREIATEVAKSEEYLIPEGFSVDYPEPPKTHLIKVTKEDEYETQLVFDISKEQPEIVQIYEIAVPGYAILLIIIAALLLIVLGYAISCLGKK